MQGFDPDVYWNGRGEVCGDYTNTPKFRLHYNYMQQWLMGKLRDSRGEICVTSLLDFGCGTGSMFNCWKGIREVFAYDRSVTMLHKARIVNRQELYGYGISSPDSVDRSLTPFKDKMFDCVAMVVVLAHLLPSDFSKFRNELRRISMDGARWLIVTNSLPHAPNKGYAWNHNYEELFGDDCKTLDDHVFEPYRYIEVAYERGGVHSKEGGVEEPKRDGIIQGHHGKHSDSPSPITPIADTTSTKVA